MNTGRAYGSVVCPATAGHTKGTLVVEIYTLQSLPKAALREQAAPNLARCVAPDGSLLVISGGREPDEERGTMPWPLTRAELRVFDRLGLREASFEDLLSPDRPFYRHFRAHYRK